MLRVLLATVLIATFGVGAASAAGRSKDERAAFWQTLHQSKQPWQGMMKKSGATPPAAQTPASNGATKPAKPQS